MFCFMILSRNGCDESIHEVSADTLLDERGFLRLRPKDGAKSIPIFWHGDGRKKGEEEMLPVVKTYVGTKIVEAWPGVKDGEEGYHVKYAGGYQSWSPKSVFERCYREISIEEGQLLLGCGNDPDASTGFDLTNVYEAAQIEPTEKGEENGKA